jgi:hypothetical protein
VDTDENGAVCPVIFCATVTVPGIIIPTLLGQLVAGYSIQQIKELVETELRNGIFMQLV